LLLRMQIDLHEKDWDYDNFSLIWTAEKSPFSC